MEKSSHDMIEKKFICGLTENVTGLFQNRGSQSTHSGGSVLAKERTPRSP